MSGTPPEQILVVDGDADSAEAVRRVLEGLGYAVYVAPTGEEGLLWFDRERPRLVLLDVAMPGRDGWEVCRVMKQHPAHGRNVRVIVLATQDDWDEKQQALRIGADDFIAKPIDLDDLPVRVQRNVALLSPTR